MTDEDGGRGRDGALPVLSLGDTNISYATTSNLSLNLDIGPPALNPEQLTNDVTQIYHATPVSSVSHNHVQVAGENAGSFVSMCHDNINISQAQSFYSTGVPQASHLEQILFQSTTQSNDAAAPHNIATVSLPQPHAIYHQGNKTNGAANSIQSNLPQYQIESHPILQRNFEDISRVEPSKESQSSESVPVSENPHVKDTTDAGLDYHLKEQKLHSDVDVNDEEDEGHEEDCNHRPKRKAFPLETADVKKRLSGAEKKMLLETAGFTKEYQCKLCEKSFLSQSMLESHEEKHVPSGETFKCRHRRCKSTFQTAAELESHQSTHFSYGDNLNLKCPVCSKLFMTRSALFAHKNIHLAVKPFLCKVCGRGFSQKPNLERHERTAHSDERPFDCAECGKAFGDKYSFKQHQSIHVAVKKFQCDTCGKLFKASQNLRHHEKQHLGERPHACSVCGRGFYQSSALKRHMNTHVGEKPFACTVCGRKFSEQSAVKNHMYTHSKQKPYKCRVCGKTFIKHIRFKRHEEAHFENGVSTLPPHPPKADVEINSVASTVPPAPVWNTQKEEFADGVTFIEENFVPVTQSCDLPPRLDEHLTEVAAAGTCTTDGLMFPHVGNALVCVPATDQGLVSVSRVQEPVLVTPPQLQAQQSYPGATTSISSQPLQANFAQADVVVSPNVVFSMVQQQAGSVPPVERNPPQVPASNEIPIVSYETFVTIQSMLKEPAVDNAIEAEVIGTDNKPAEDSPKETANGNDFSFGPESDNVESEDVDEQQAVESSELSTSDVFENPAGLGQLYTCDGCMEVFPGADELNRHQLVCNMPETEENDQYKCPQCSKCFRSAPQLSVHIGSEHTEKTTDSPPHHHQSTQKRTSKRVKREKAKSTESLEASEELSRLHKVPVAKNKEKRFNCEKCGQTFGQRINLKRHQSSTHEQGESASVCEECGKVCYDKYALSAHMVSHRTERNFQCKTCGKLFKGSQHLRHHERQHLDVKPHACGDCGKTFYQATALRRHKRTHSGEKPYRCATCGRGFGDATSYRNHQFTHTEQKPYCCADCGKTFIKHARFRQHVVGDKCPGKNLPSAAAAKEARDEITRQYNIAMTYPPSASSSSALSQQLEKPMPQMVQMVAQPVPIQQLQQQQHHYLADLPHIDTQQQQQQQQQQQHETRNTALVGEGGELLWQFEGVRGDQRIMVQPLRDSSQGSLMG